MRRTLFGAVTVSALLSAASLNTASAADIGVPGKAPPGPPPAYDWTGFYLEVHGGYAAGWPEFDVPPATGSIGNTWRASGGFGGGAIGYNYEFGASHIVAGLQAEWNGSSIKGNTVDNIPGLLAAHTATLNEFGSVDARLGFALVGFPWDKILLYMIGGVAFGDPNQTATKGGASFSFSGGDSTGWDFGAGLEFAVTQNWTVRGEYRQYNFSKTSLSAGGFLAAPFSPFGTQETVQTGRAGIAYKF